MQNYIHKIFEYKILERQEPTFLSLDTIRTHLRILTDSVTDNLNSNDDAQLNNNAQLCAALSVDNNLINRFLFTAIDYAERFLRMHLVTKTISCNIQTIRSCNYYLPVIPAQKIIKIQDTNKQDISLNLYQLSRDRKSLLCKKNCSNGQWITIKYTTSTIPEKDIENFIVPGLLLHISELYDHLIVSAEAFANINQIYQSYRKILI